MYSFISEKMCNKQT